MDSTIDDGARARLTLSARPAPTDRINRAVRRDLSFTKFDLLFFDQIAVLDLERQLDALRAGNLAAGADIDFLINRGVVVPLPGTVSGVLDYISELGSPRQVVFTETTFSLDMEGSEESSHPQLGSGFDRLVAAAERGSGLGSVACIASTDEPKPRSSPVPHSGATLSVLDLGHHYVTADLISVVLESLPRPSPNVALQDLLDFRANEEATEKLLALRRWLETIAAEGKTARAAALELESSLADYRAALRAHSIDWRSRPFSALLRAGASLADGGLSALVGFPGLFDANRRRHHLLKAELEAPGRAVAYLDLVDSAFGR